MEKNKKPINLIILILLVLCHTLFSGTIKINEIMSMNNNRIQDEDGDFSDWIELFNNNDSPVNLEGFGISDDESDLSKWTFPNITIEPNDYLLIFASSKDRQNTNHWETIITWGDIWTFRVNNSEVSGDWKSIDFDDSEWNSGPTGIGYGDDDDATEIPENTISVYARKIFQIENINNITGAMFHIDYDDGFVAYINGVEIARKNISGTNPSWDQSADTYLEPLIVSGQPPEEFAIENFGDFLVQGENVLAIQIHNSDTNSSDMTLIPFLTLGMTTVPNNAQGTHNLIDLSTSFLHTNFKINSNGETIFLTNNENELLDEVVMGKIPADISYGRKPDGAENWVMFDEPTPNSENNTSGITGFAVEPEFSKTRGFYESTFELVINSPENLKIKYTLDGSNPKTSTNAIISQSPATITINPLITAGQRGQNPGVVVRAVCYGAGYADSKVATHTYLFARLVQSLSPDGQKPGPNWPEPYSGWDAHIIDYGMDPDITTDSRYQNLIDDALLDIPSFNISTDLENLFDNQNGIYINSNMHGKEWERPVSVELLNPDGTEGFQINAGLRIRGGWSRHDNNPKHAFRLFFREEYGDSKLEFPLFGNEGVDEFDKIDLRTSQNYSWSYYGDPLNTMNRDVFSRDIQKNMGQPYTRSRYYHLYLNGVYWGLYQSQERPEARFAASYFGGDPEDYDVIKVDIGEFWNLYDVEATDGNLDAWQDIWDICQDGFYSNENYFKLEGLNQTGERDTSLKVLVDIDNLIDYMLIIFYTGNYDAPVSKFSGNYNPNNFYAIYNRNRNEGFKFFIHDAEHTLLTDAVNVGSGLYENRVNIGNVSNDQMQVWDFKKFHPQWLHHKLTDNGEYRLRFADHVYKHFYRNGVFKPANLIELFLGSANAIDMAIIGESARWGDVKTHPPRTKDDDWQPAIENIIINYFPLRTGIVKNQIIESNLYPDINPPVLENNGEIKEYLLEVEPDFELQISNPNDDGSILYTIDGNDPRNIGGPISSSAIENNSQANLTISNTTLIKARIKNGSIWSALTEVLIVIDSDMSNLRITEIHYHPADQDSINDTEYEFVELKNIGDNKLNLFQCQFSDGIEYTFPSETFLQSGEFILLASNKEEFNNRYGFMPFDEYEGQLRNSGEQILLMSAVGDTIFSIEYNDKNPWPESADGDGYSLVPVMKNPETNSEDPKDWRASTQIHGSPGEDDKPSSIGKNAEIAKEFRLYQNYPNPFNPSTNISYHLPASSQVNISIFNIQGQRVLTLKKGFQTAGFHKILWNAHNEKGIKCTNGIYFCKIIVKSGERTISKSSKMLLLK